MFFYEWMKRQFITDQLKLLTATGFFETGSKLEENLRGFFSKISKDSFRNFSWGVFQKFLQNPLEISPRIALMVSRGISPLIPSRKYSSRDSSKNFSRNSSKNSFSDSFRNSFQDFSNNTLWFLHEDFYMQAPVSIGLQEYLQEVLNKFLQRFLRGFIHEHISIFL